MQGWIGVDLDGTLAEYQGWPNDGSIGKPIPAMVERVKAWLAEGKDVRIFTARVWPLGTLVENDFETRDRVGAASVQSERIRGWSVEHIGKELPVTCIKDFLMVELWDDRAVQVEINTARRVDGKE